MEGRNSILSDTFILSLHQTSSSVQLLPITGGRITVCSLSVFVCVKFKRSSCRKRERAKSGGGTTMTTW